MSDHNSLRKEENRADILERFKTVMSPELFEKLYLQPQNSVNRDLRKTSGNPTPLGLIGFVLALTPLACCLMGWGGAGGLGAANIGVYFFLGGPLLIFSGILEFFLGNTFTFVVFTTYGTVFLSLAATLQPDINSAGAYSPDKDFDYAKGSKNAAYHASIAFFPMSVACLNVLFMICAIKINAVFLITFFGASVGFASLASSMWATVDATIKNLQVCTGAAWFVCAVLGWYLLLTQLLVVMEFDITLPVGDFGSFWARRALRKLSKGKHEV